MAQHNGDIGYTHEDHCDIKQAQDDSMCSTIPTPLPAATTVQNDHKTGTSLSIVTHFDSEQVLKHDNPSPALPPTVPTGIVKPVFTQLPVEFVHILDSWLATGKKYRLLDVLDRLYEATSHHYFWDIGDEGGCILAYFMEEKYPHLVLDSG